MPLVVGKSNNYYITFKGDSVTFGQNASPESNRWSNLLTNYLGKSEINLAVSGTSASSTGPNPALQNDMGIKRDNQYLLFITYGLNDCWRPGCTPTTYETGLTNIINNAIAKGWIANNIKVTSDWFMENANYFYANYDLILAKTVSVCATYGIQLIDFYTYGQSNGDASWLSVDTVHPTNLGYQKKYEFIRDNIILP